jgi:hypothetical protein
MLRTTLRPHHTDFRDLMQSTEYFLRDHVFFCVAGTFCLFLDLKTDQYLCTETRTFECLAPHLHGWPSSAAIGARDKTSLTQDARCLARELVSKDILSEYSVACKRAIPTSWELPTESLVTQREPTSVFYNLTRIASFFAATIKANRRLSVQPLHVTVRAIAERKAAGIRAGTSVDYDSAEHLTSAFYALRLTFPRNYLCLFDSLALLDFLSLYKIFPTWVFGVRPEPFLAHCWVQAGGVVLNDTVEHTSGFVPIMTV